MEWFDAWVERNRKRPEWFKWCVLIVGVTYVMWAVWKR